MPGRLVYLMGPSGAGKDTVLQGVLRLMGNQAFLAPRVVTRDAHLAEAGTLAVTEHEFTQMEAAGLLAMAWRAHGLAYGVLRHVDDRLAAGQRSEEHMSELQSRENIVCRLLLEKKKKLVSV